MLTFEYQGVRYEYPTSLTEVTLGQRIAFQTMYGDALDARAKAFMEAEISEDREFEEMMLMLDAATCTFSFFTGISLDEVRANLDAQQVYNIYISCLQQIVHQSQADQATVTEVLWNGQMWHIAPPELSADSEMTFNEFLTAKEAVRQLFQLGKGHWEALQYLCAVYLRKPGEKFQESFVHPTSDRFNLMLTVPLDIALAVGFFLTSSMNSCIEISAFLNHDQAKELT